MNDKFKFLLLLSSALVILFTSCVDTSVGSLPNSVTYYSQLKFTNLVSGANSATLTLNGVSLGTVNFGNEAPDGQSAFLTTTSGSKTLVANFGSVSKTYQFAATTEYRIRAFLIGTTSSSPEIIAFTQRYIWQTKDSDNGKALFPSDTGHVSIFNGSPNVVVNNAKFMSAADTVNFDDPLAFGKASGYAKLKAGAYAVEAVCNDTLKVTFNMTLAAKGRYTVAIYDLAANIKNAIFLDD
jgi:hypothetical protein